MGCIAQEMHALLKPVDSSPAAWMVGDCPIVQNEMEVSTETISDKSLVSLMVNNTIKIFNWCSRKFMK